MDLKERTDQRRRLALAGLNSARQAALGQFFTPARAADLIASMLRLDGLKGTVKVLDPGAGVGSLVVALVERLRRESPDLVIDVTAVEMDPALTPVLSETLNDLTKTHDVAYHLVEGNYIELAASRDESVSGPFDLVIQNPPYGKLGAEHPARIQTAISVVDVPNIYAAFWALSVDSLAQGGQCVAIVPRSWANGTYFTAFRKWMLDEIFIDRLHVFESRSTVFADTGVLQENVIVSGTRGVRGKTVTLSASVGHEDEISLKEVPPSVVVVPGDRHAFVRFTDGATSVPATAKHTLADIGLKASTGRVVDFRARHRLSFERKADAVPMVYQGNVRDGRVIHPRDAVTKPQWFLITESAAQKQTNAPGCYVIIKRFSAKEERRRVVAGVWNGDGQVAFDNKTNYVHEGGKPLDPVLAQGLCVWLNSSPLDDVFRTFSGHTQVNVGDLGVLPFPSRRHLLELGRALPGDLSDQELIDKVVDRVLSA